MRGGKAVFAKGRPTNTLRCSSCIRCTCSRLVSAWSKPSTHAHWITRESSWSTTMTISSLCGRNLTRDKEPRLCDHGEAEVDPAKCGVINEAGKEHIHVGRLLAVAARDTAQKVLIPLNDRCAPSGRNPGPETLGEVHPHLQRVLVDGDVQVSNSAQAYAKSARQSMRPAVKVSHAKLQFSKLDKLPKTTMTPRLRHVADSRGSSSAGSIRMAVTTNYTSASPKRRRRSRVT